MARKVIISDDCNYPITVDQVKEFIRVYNTDQDNYIAYTLIPAVVEYLETALNKSITDKEIEYSVSNIRVNDVLILPLSPVLTVESITTDGSDVSGNIDIVDNYMIRIDSANYVENLKVRYKTEGIDGPQIRNALLALCAAWFADRLNAETPKSVQTYIKQNTLRLWF